MSAQLSPRSERVQAVRRGREAVRRQLMFNANPPNWNLALVDANNSRVVYENKALPPNAVNMVTQNAFKVGDKVLQYGRNKYMKVSDFAKFLMSPRGGKFKLKDFLNANGNKNFTSPEGIVFRKGQAKFYRFI